MRRPDQSEEAEGRHFVPPIALQPHFVKTPQRASSFKPYQEYSTITKVILTAFEAPEYTSLGILCKT
jgi:hypothetical protein